MSLNKRPYKGCRDLYPEEKRIQNYLFEKMAQTAELFGYEPYDGPMLEEVELYKAKSGEELINDQIYSFVDRGDRHVAIRPEMTPTLARMVSNIYKEYPLPLRWYSIPNLMRYERPQKGRLREHWQFNCDIFGAPGREGEVEILQVAITLMEKLGASEKEFSILLNDRMIVDGIFKHLLSLNKDSAYRLYKIIDKSKKINQTELESLVKQIDLDGKENIFFDYLKLKSFQDLFSFLDQHKLNLIKDHFLPLVSTLTDMGLDKYITYDPSIVRGLDYYTGIVFEIFDKNPENPRAISGGGSYQNLLKIFNEADDFPGVGFGLGDVTLKDFLTTHGLLPDFSRPQLDLYLTSQTEAGLSIIKKLAQSLRQYNVKVSVHLNSIKLKKAFSIGEKRGATFLGILGDQELADQKIQIKKLGANQQTTFLLSDSKKIERHLRGINE